MLRWGVASSGHTTVYGHAVVPDEPQQELSSIAYADLNEQLYEQVAKMRLQPKQHALFDAPGRTPTYFRVAEERDPVWTIDEVAAFDHERLQAAAGAAEPWVAPLAVIEEEAHERDREFRQ